MVAVGSDCPKGKAQYATKAAAEEAARWMRRKHRGSGTINAFRCGWCGCWHIGNKGGDTSKGRRRR
jgi:hypothetical protein